MVGHQDGIVVALPPFRKTVFRRCVLLPKRRWPNQKKNKAAWHTWYSLGGQKLLEEPLLSIHIMYNLMVRLLFVFINPEDHTRKAKQYFGHSKTTKTYTSIPIPSHLFLFSGCSSLKSSSPCLSQVEQNSLTGLIGPCVASLDRENMGKAIGTPNVGRDYLRQLALGF